MENVRQQVNRPIVAIIIGLLGGIILALIIGYWLWPVQWYNSSYANLRSDLQDEVMRGAINSYSLDGDVNLANFRYSQFGESGSTVLADVAANPQNLNPADIQAFSAAVNAQPPAAPTPTSSRSTLVTVLIVIILLLFIGFVLVAGVLFLLRRGGKEEPEETFVAGEGLIPTPVEPQEEVQEEMYEDMPQEPAAEEWSMPPAAAGAAAVAGAAYVLDESEEPVMEDFPFEPEPTEEAAEIPAELHPMDSEKMSYHMDYIEGIGPVYADKLKAVGINTPKDLLERGSTPKGRQEIADSTGISDKLVLKWVNHVDLYRIKGIGSEYADLLEIAGVDTVVELATRNPANLYQRLVSINIEKRLVRKVPFPSQVEDWIEQAKQLPRVITY